MRSPQETALFAIGLVSSFIPPLVASRMVPVYGALFKGAALDLPLLSYVVVNYYDALWVLPILVIATRYWWPVVDARSTAACFIGVGALVSFLPLLFIAIYWPLSQFAK